MEAAVLVSPGGTGGLLVVVVVVCSNPLRDPVEDRPDKWARRCRISSNRVDVVDDDDDVVVVGGGLFINAEPVVVGVFLAVLLLVVLPVVDGFRGVIIVEELAASPLEVVANSRLSRNSSNRVKGRGVTKLRLTKRPHWAGHEKYSVP